MTGTHSSDSALISALMYLTLQSSSNSAALCVIEANDSALDYAYKTDSTPNVHGETYTSIRLSVVSDNGSCVFPTWQGSNVSGSDCRDYSAELEALLDKIEKTEAVSNALLSGFRSTALGMLAGSVWLVLFILFQALTTS